MRLMNLILLLASGTYAFTIPQGQPDGIYSVTYNADGTETHTLLDPPTTEANQNTTRQPFNGESILPSKRFRRQGVPNSNNHVGCGDYFLDVGETNAANGAIDAQCGNGAFVDGGKDFYSIVGCTVAYFCNYTHQGGFPLATQCWAADRQACAPLINGRCGAFGAGWVSFHSNIDLYDGQYGWENVCNQGSNFCGRGTNGK